MGTDHYRSGSTNRPTDPVATTKTLPGTNHVNNDTARKRINNRHGTLPTTDTTVTITVVHRTRTIKEGDHSTEATGTTMDERVTTDVAHKSPDLQVTLITERVIIAMFKVISVDFVL